MRITLEINKRLLDVERYRLLSCIPDAEWRAVQETVLEHLESATQYATDDSVAKEPSSVSFYCGQMASLRLLLAALETLRDKGGKNVEE